MDYKVKSSDFKTPPEDSYFLDLIWIEQVEGDKGPYLRWTWIISDVEGQGEFNMCRASSMTPLTPTMNNRFGEFIRALTGSLQLEATGSTEGLILARYRVKGFLTHNKKQGDKGEVVYCNINKLVEGTAKKNAGIGYKGVSEKMKEQVNAFLKTQGLPLLPLDSRDASQARPAAAKAAPVAAPKSEDVPW